MFSNDWKLPLNIAVGVHVLVLLGGLYLPGLFKAKPKFADIYTVSIINIAEPMEAEAPQAESEPPPPTPTKVKAEKIKAKKVAPIAEVAEPVAPQPVKAISIKPLKRKKKKKVKKVTKQPPKRDQAKQQRQKLADALRQEELLAERARIAREALEAERNLLKPQPTVTRSKQSSSASTTKSSGNSSSSRGSSNLIEAQYLGAIKNRIHQFWALPEYLQANQELTAIVVITINKNGKIANKLFENRSGDRLFDQFVAKTIDSADPLPPIPPALKKQRFEIGLVFKPGGIQ